MESGQPYETFILNHFLVEERDVMSLLDVIVEQSNILEGNLCLTENLNVVETVFILQLNIEQSYLKPTANRRLMGWLIQLFIRNGAEYKQESITQTLKLMLTMDEDELGAYESDLKTFIMICMKAI